MDQNNALTLLAQFAISLIVPILLIYLRQKRLPNHPSLDDDLDCNELQRQHAAVERKINMLFASHKIGMEDLRVMCYESLDIPLNDICSSGTKRDCAIQLILTARKHGKMLELWKAIARNRNDLINDI